MNQMSAVVKLEPVPVPAALADDSIERLVDELKLIWSRSAVSTLVAVGEAIVRACYHGDIERWRNRGPNARLRRLQSHTHLPFARKTVHLSMHFYDLSLRVAGSPFLLELGVGHVRAVLGLPSTEQERLLRAAYDEHWTIAELSERAMEIRNRRGRRTGRPPRPEHQRMARQIRSHVEALEELLASESLAQVLPAERLAQVLQSLIEVKEDIDSWGGSTVNVPGPPPIFRLEAPTDRARARDP